ncbi:hypothetical protein ACLOJK_003638 [Asimina triloba]
MDYSNRGGVVNFTANRTTLSKQLLLPSHGHQPAITVADWTHPTASSFHSDAGNYNAALDLKLRPSNLTRTDRCYRSSPSPSGEKPITDSINLSAKIQATPTETRHRETPMAAAFLRAFTLPQFRTIAIWGFVFSSLAEMEGSIPICRETGWWGPSCLPVWR